mgnify:CR=1 FL=1
MHDRLTERLPLRVGTLLFPADTKVGRERRSNLSGNLLADTYIDGTALSYESKGKPQVETMDLGGPPGEKVNHLRLGFFTHDSSGTGNVYIDDVAVSTTRIGCSD